MTSDPSNRKSSENTSRQASVLCDVFEGYDVISVLKNSIEYSFEFVKCFIIHCLGGGDIDTCSPPRPPPPVYRQN